MNKDPNPVESQESEWMTALREGREGAVVDVPREIADVIFSSDPATATSIEDLQRRLERMRPYENFRDN